MKNVSQDLNASQYNSDIAPVPHSSSDVQEGVAPLTSQQQVEQLNDYFEDNYPELFRSLTTDEAAAYRDSGESIPAELIDSTERMWARFPDLLSHTQAYWFWGQVWITVCRM